MGVGIEYQVEGMERLMERAKPELLAKPVHDFLERAALMVKAKAREYTPVDTGRLRASMTHQLDSSPVPLWARVGSNVEYAPFVELGTRPHFPPPEALELWARRHGIPVFLVCRAIARRGTKAHRMLQRGFEDLQDKIGRMMKQLAESVKQEWEK